jgi:long-chain acyl-CoA synthetase
VGIYAKNRWEWSTAQQALFSYSISSVPLYDTLGAEALAYIVQQAGLKTVFVSKLEAGKVITCKTSQPEAFSTLVNLIQFEDVSEASRKAAADVGITLRSFTEVSEAGSFNKKDHIKPRAEDIAVICYT